MPRPPKLTTLPKQQQAANQRLDRGKKAVAGCLIGLGFLFFTWRGYPGFSQLMIACFAFAAALLVWLKQLGLARFFKLLLSAGCCAAGVYFTVNGALLVFFSTL